MNTIKIVLLIAGFITIARNNIFLCTLWSANGNSTKDNITLIAKNYDWFSDHKTFLKQIPASTNTFAYFGVYAEHVKPANRGFVAGINEKGLVIVTADASSIPYKIIDAIKDRKKLLVYLLSNYADIPSIIKNGDIFKTSMPETYLIADKENIMYVEVAIDGKYSIKTENNGILFHTNHYIDKKLLYSNIKIRKSSQLRYERIGSLLSKNTSKFTIDDFITFSNDKNDGPDNSICRTGSNEKSVRTLTSWVVELQKKDYPVIYIKLVNPGEQIKEYRFRTDDKFWKNNFIN